jgi:hypothetical protein
MRREWEAQRDALATVRRFNARLSMVLAQDRRCDTSKHHWLVINCDSCGTMVDLRDLDASIRLALLAGRALLRWRGIRPSKDLLGKRVQDATAPPEYHHQNTLCASRD